MIRTVIDLVDRAVWWSIDAFIRACEWVSDKFDSFIDCLTSDISSQSLRRPDEEVQALLDKYNVDEDGDVIEPLPLRGTITALLECAKEVGRTAREIEALLYGAYPLASISARLSEMHKRKEVFVVSKRGTRSVYALTKYDVDLMRPLKMEDVG